MASPYQLLTTSTRIRLQELAVDAGRSIEATRKASTLRLALWVSLGSSAV